MKKLRFLTTILFLCSMFLYVGACTNDSSIENNCDHNYIETSTTEPTCNKEGKKIFICIKCENSKIITIEKKAHTYDSVVTRQATCAQTGIETFTCDMCNDSYTVDIPKLDNHTYVSVITRQATCGQTGIETFTCDTCNDSYTVDIPKLDNHIYSKNNVCKACGENTQIKLKMTEEEKNAALSVKSANITMLPENNCYVIKITFKNNDDSSFTNNNTVVVPAILDFVITNKSGKIVYSDVVEVKTSDYSIFDVYGTMWASIKIPYNKLNEEVLGKIYITAYNPGYFMRGEAQQDVPMRLSLPTTPKQTSYKDYSGTSLVETTSITIDYRYSLISIYLSGKCIVHAGASNTASNKRIGYRIFDSEGSIVESGTVSTPSILENESFKNIEILLSASKFKAGNIYSLELTNVT